MLQKQGFAVALVGVATARIKRPAPIEFMIPANGVIAPLVPPS